MSGGPSPIGIPPEQRRRVLWVGGNIPPTLLGACASRELTIEAIQPDEIEHAAPFACALIIEYGPGGSGLIPTESSVIATALSHGLFVALTKHADANTSEYERDTEPFARSHPNVTMFHGNYEITAQSAARHVPGPGANVNLRLEGDVPEDPEAITLLRRALHDLTSARLRLIPGARSGASVWLVTPGIEDQLRMSRPWLIKLHDKLSIDKERSNFASQVENRIPWDTRPRVCSERCVIGATKALLVQDFVENAQPLREAWDTQVPDALFGGLFGHALRDWSRTPTTVRNSLGAEFERIKALRWSEHLEEAAALAGSGFPAPDDLKRMIASWPEVEYLQSTIHADLHTGNLFVTGPAQVIVIDFERVTHGPVISDRACLEVSLVFGAPGPAAAGYARLPDGGSAAGIAWLRATYIYPLNPANVPVLQSEPKRADAVRALRGEARKCETDSIPYAVAVASYLLRVASFADNPLEDRALAYELAASLLLGVDAALRNRAS